MDDLIIANGEDLNTEFDKWLGNQLKNTQVEPPQNFNRLVLEKLSETRPKGLADPTILFFLLVMVVGSTILLTLSSLSSNFLYSLSQQFSALRFQVDIIVTTQIVLGVTIIGLIFLGLDYILFRRIAGKDLTYG